MRDGRDVRLPRRVGLAQLLQRVAPVEVSFREVGIEQGGPLEVLGDGLHAAARAHQEERVIGADHGPVQGVALLLLLRDEIECFLEVSGGFVRLPRREQSEPDFAVSDGALRVLAHDLDEFVHRALHARIRRSERDSLTGGR